MALGTRNVLSLFDYRAGIRQVIASGQRETDIIPTYPLTVLFHYLVS